MAYFTIMMLLALFIPAVMLFAGFMMDKHTPKKINGIYGYRTSQSMKNKDTWEFAHHYCGKLWVKIGAALLVATLIVMLLFMNKDHETIGTAVTIIETVQVVGLVLSILPVEKALKKTFDEKGRRRGAEDGDA